MSTARSPRIWRQAKSRLRSLIQCDPAVRIAELGHWYEPDKLMGYFVALYFGKLLVWDKVLGLGTTDPLPGLRP